jgi:hypothetical protein
MNNLFIIIKTYINSKVDYYKTRSKLNKGNKLYVYATIPEVKCYCDKCISNYNIEVLNNVIDVVYDIKDKYNVILNYDYSIGRVNDDFVKHTMTVKVELEKDNFAEQRTLEELKYYE